MRSGSRFAGFSSGCWPAARACCRSASIGGFGRLFSMRSRIIRSSSAARDSARRFVASISIAFLYSMSAPSSWSFDLELMCAADVFARRALHRPLERNLERGVVRVLLDRLGEVRHRSVPVARTGGLLAPTVRMPGGTSRAQAASVARTTKTTSLCFNADTPFNVAVPAGCGVTVTVARDSELRAVSVQGIRPDGPSCAPDRRCARSRWTRRQFESAGNARRWSPPRRRTAASTGSHSTPRPSGLASRRSR